MARSSLSPGFRFHPTDVELVMYYLKKKLLRKKPVVEAVAEVNIYDFSPWDLPDKSNLRSRDLEWFFFCPKVRKYSTGSRAKRATETGFWKATGKDRPVEYKQRIVAMIKTLVFHLGHAPNGQRTDWVMHEYRMDDKDLANQGVVQDAYVLCKIFKKSGAGPKNGAQYGAPFNEDEWDDDDPPAVVVGPDGATGLQPGSAYSLSLTEPGSSTAVGPDGATGPKPVTTYYGSLTELGSSTVVGLDGATGPEPGGACCGLLTEPGSSTIMNYADGINVDDVALTAEEIAFIMDENVNNKDKGVEDGKEKKVEGGDGFYEELGSFINLEDLDGLEPNMLKIGYTLDDTLLGDDDLDTELRGFYVD